MEVMEVMGVMDFIELGLTKADAAQTFWNHYLVVITGIVGIYASEKILSINKAIKIFLTILFLMFVASNINGLLKNWDMRDAISDAAKTTKDYNVRTHQVIVNLIPPSSRPLNIGFHLFMDVIMVLFIWFGVEFKHKLTSRSSVTAQ